MNKPPKPRTPSPTTLKPITDPPLNATFRAVVRLVRAALVVRVLALVATFIPRKPASPDVTAPTMNEREINTLESALPLLANPRRIATTATKIASTRYSAFKNAIAPSAILLPIDFIRSVPSSCASIQLVFQKE